MWDLTNHYQGLYPVAVKAEQKRKNLLILFGLEEPRPFDLDKKKIAAFELSYRWLRDENDLTSVMGSEISFWTQREGNRMIKEGCFKSLNLF
jgi:hypothetical protein